MPYMHGQVDESQNPSRPEFSLGTCQDAVLEYAEVRIDRYRHRAFAGSRELRLTPTEFRILGCLLAEPGRVLTREELMQMVWADQKTRSAKTLTWHMKELRRKLAVPDFIEAVYKTGYRVRDGRGDP
jgi:two-component system phosphate regulon response regulator PhoB